MATATEFDTAAEQFARAADAIGSWPGDVTTDLGDDTVRGGALSAACVEVARAVEATAATLVAVLTDRAEHCRRLAVRCRAYEAALADYEAAERTWRQHLARLADGTGSPRATVSGSAGLPPRPVRPVRPPFMT